MDRVRGGCADALGELYDRHGRQAFRIAMAVCRDAGDAEDAVQNAFVSIWQGRDTFSERRGNVRAWVLSIVRYRAIDIARTNATRVSRLDDAGTPDTVPAPDDVPQHVMASDERAHMLALLECLPDAQREVITLAFWGGLTHTEIAAHLDLPEGTVKGRMRLGLHRLRTEIGETREPGIRGGSPASTSRSVSSAYAPASAQVARRQETPGQPTV